MPPKRISAGTSPIFSRRSSRSATPINRGTSPINTKQFNKLMGNLNNGQYTTLHQLPAVNTPINLRHYLRRAVLGGLTGLGGLAAYYYREPLIKLGHQVYDYARDKFHNLFASNTSTPNVPGLHHN